MDYKGPILVVVDGKIKISGDLAFYMLATEGLPVELTELAIYEIVKKDGIHPGMFVDERA